MFKNLSLFKNCTDHCVKKGLNYYFYAVNVYSCRLNIHNLWWYFLCKEYTTVIMIFWWKLFTILHFGVFSEKTLNSIFIVF